VIPTLGRPELLRGCLESLVACDPRAEEIIVVAQGDETLTSEVVASFAAHGARTIWCEGRGRGRALNLGLTEARNELILITDDDCRVSPEWVRVAAASVGNRPDLIVTGRVLAAGESELVPSQIDDPNAHEYSGSNGWGMLYGGNMACNRTPLQGLGAFDETMVPAAEDDELSYRWVKAGLRIRYEPALVVWHVGWRSPTEMKQQYRGYAYGQGVFYGKHARLGDRRLLWSAVKELYAGFRGVTDVRLSKTGSSIDPRRGILPGLPRGFATGWRAAGPRPRSGTRDPAPRVHRVLAVVRKTAREIRPVYLAWQLLSAIRAAAEDSAVQNRKRVDNEFSVEDPWNYATSRQEQLCLQHQLDVLDRLRAGKKFREVCEVGCAEGVFTSMLLGQSDSLVALDLSRAAVARARQRFSPQEPVSVRQWDLRTDQLPGTYDLIVVAGVLEYFHRRPDLRAATMKLIDGLKAGGHLFVVTTKYAPAEAAWWPGLLPRGRRINEYVARQADLRTVVEEEGAEYLITVLQKQPSQALPGTPASQS
jgi:GT2 family glycosyltransferase/SAM-dependent methyltransferase